MTPFVFATAPTPAQFISGWQHLGWLRCGTHNERLWGYVGQLAVAHLYRWSDINDSVSAAAKNAFEAPAGNTQHGFARYTSVT